MQGRRLSFFSGGVTERCSDGPTVSGRHACSVHRICVNTHRQVLQARTHIHSFKSYARVCTHKTLQSCTCKYTGCKAGGHRTWHELGAAGPAVRVSLRHNSYRRPHSPDGEQPCSAPAFLGAAFWGVISCKPVHALRCCVGARVEVHDAKFHTAPLPSSFSKHSRSPVLCLPASVPR